MFLRKIYLCLIYAHHDDDDDDDDDDLVFYSLSTLFKSHGDDGRLIMKAIQSCVEFRL